MPRERPRSPHCTSLGVAASPEPRVSCLSGCPSVVGCSTPARRESRAAAPASGGCIKRREEEAPLPARPEKCSQQVLIGFREP